VDAASTLDVVYADHCSWLRNSIGATEVIMATCGNWDLQTHLPREAKLKRLGIDKLYHRFINVKDEYRTVYGRKVSGMPELLTALEIELVGRHHSGIDDTRNIASAMLKMIHHGHVCSNFSIRHVKY
jgi:ERI1 exoribonuclease 3